MLSFGIEAALAFSTAFWSERLPAGSGPPSFAATMIARESFEKSLPRLASAAPFLCLIDDHLLCPDTQRLPYSVQKQLVHPSVVRQLGVERCHQHAPVANELGQHLHVVAGHPYTRCADEDAPQRQVVARQRQVGLEARHLAPVGVPVALDVHETEMVPVENNHACARTKDRLLERTDRLVETVELHQTHERRRLSAGNHEAVKALQMLRFPHFDRIDAESLQHRHVFAEIALDGEDADTWAHYQPRVSSSSSGAREAVARPLIASPRPRETRARISASP